MGLQEPTWIKDGKVHPAVREVLNKEKKLDEIPEKELYTVLFKPMRPVGFLRMTYVAVYLKHDQQGSSKENRASIKKVQRSVLSKLTAAEFSVFLRFQDQAAILGFVSAEGLEKLSKDEDVLGIGLDSKPLPLTKTQRGGRESGWQTTQDRSPSSRCAGVERRRVRGGGRASQEG